MNIPLLQNSALSTSDRKENLQFLQHVTLGLAGGWRPGESTLIMTAGLSERGVPRPFSIGDCEE